MSQVFPIVQLPPRRAMSYASLYLAQALAEIEQRQRVFDKAQQRIADKRPKLGRNDACWCGSGNKFKRCHYPNQ
jgi:uncharacterized protein YecA (UPF0149 family)